MELFSNQSDLSKLSYKETEKIALDCKACKLCETRTKVVFGCGPVPCNIMLIGEAPGADEDMQGLPFIGRAGQLLTQILASVDIKRPDDIYITNTVKCRPPQNRAPMESEQKSCYPFLETQIFNLIKPKIILLAGAPAVKDVLKTDEPISKIRGQWFKLPNTDISVMPIFHPSYLLRNPRKDIGSPKWQTWQDMQEIKNALNYIKQIKKLEKTI